MMPVPLHARDTSLIHLKDTAGHALPIRLRFQGFRVWLQPDTVMSPEEPYEIHLGGALVGEKDTVYRFAAKPFVKEDYGTFSGEGKGVGL